MHAKRFGTLAPLLALLATAGCVTPQQYDPFKVTEAEVRSRVDTIALAPLRVSSDLVDPPAARAAIEPLVTAKLERAGFRVVPSAEFDALWRAAASAIGDVYDPKTGEANKERWEAVEDAVYHDLAKQHGADALLYLQISVEEFPLPTQRLWFCGTQGELYWPGGLPLFARPTLAYATCLNASLYDMEERALYSIRSGLQTTQTYALQTWAERPKEELLRDEAALQNAVGATLGRLAGDAPKKR
jgi:hypothetical protein